MMTPLNPADAKLAAAWEHPGTLFAICHDSQSNRLFAAGTDWSVYAADLAADEFKAGAVWTHHENFVSAMVCTGGTLISGSFDRRLIWAETDGGEKLRSVEAHDGWVRDLVLLNGELLASVGDDMTVAIWEVETGRLVHRLAGHERQTPEGFHSALYAIAASGDGKVVASGDRVGRIVLWDVERGEPIGRLNAPAFYTFDGTKRARSIGGIRSLAFSPDGSKLAVAGIGQVSNVDGFVGPCRVEVFDWESNKRIFAGQDSHKAVLNHVAFHPEESWLIAAGGGDSGGIVAFWDLEKQPPVHKAKLKGHVQRFCLDPVQPRLFAAGFGGLQIWSFEKET